MNAESWILLAGVLVPIVGALLGWLVYIERRMLTRDEYERISRDARDDAADKLDRILDEIKDAAENQHKLRNAVNDLALKVAVLTDRSEHTR